MDKVLAALSPPRAAPFAVAAALVRARCCLTRYTALANLPAEFGDGDGGLTVVQLPPATTAAAVRSPA